RNTINNFIYYLEGLGKSGLYKKGTPRYPTKRKVLKTYESYYGVTKKDVEKLLRLYRVYIVARYPPPAPRALQAILSREIFERV
ncbi:uncharacterized protein K452DRAFT_293241, partial [Aplosporella prunicola CBS 121167]